MTYRESLEAELALAYAEGLLGPAGGFIYQLDVQHDLDCPVLTEAADPVFACDCDPDFVWHLLDDPRGDA